jgi:hypothetical protein
VRPLNFTVRGARVSHYLDVISTSSLPLRWEAVAALGVLLSVVGHALSKRALSTFRAQSYIAGDRTGDSEQRWGWVLHSGQFVYAAAIFLVGLYAGGAGFTFLAGGLLIALLFWSAQSIRTIVYYQSLAKVGAARGSVSMSAPMMCRGMAQSYAQAALFCATAGLALVHLSLLGGGLILGLLALEYRRQMRRAEAHL